MASTIDLGPVIGPTGPTGPTGPNYSSISSKISITNSTSNYIHHMNTLSDIKISGNGSSLDKLSVDRIENGYITYIEQLNIASFTFYISPFVLPQDGLDRITIPRSDDTYCSIDLGKLDTVIIYSRMIFEVSVIFNKDSSIKPTSNLRNIYLLIDSGYLYLIFDPISSGDIIISYDNTITMRCETPYIPIEGMK